MFTRQVILAFSLILLAGTAPAWADTVTVTIDKLVFSPASVEVKVGDTIEWVNKDAFPHTATVKGGWDVSIPPKKAASVTVQKAGSFDYICRFHPNMKGHVTVSK
jgi:plastocyanin